MSGGSTTKTKYFAPLKIEIHNFKSYRKIGNLKIRKIRSDELEKYFGVEDVVLDDNGHVIDCTKLYKPQTSLSFLITDLEFIKLIGCRYIIESVDQKDIYETIPKLLLAFRLYKSGEIFAPVIMNNSTPSVSFIYPLFTKEKDKYEINLSELRKIDKIYEIIKKNKRSNLELAFERFNNAISDKTDNKNAFIDFVTILESLFLKNTKQEVRFRFSLYVSYLLCNKIKIKETFREIQYIYDARSELVHSGKSKNYNNERFLKIKEYTRLLLLWYLEQQGIDSIKDSEILILKKLNINDK